MSSPNRPAPAPLDAPDSGAPSVPSAAPAAAAAGPAPDPRHHGRDLAPGVREVERGVFRIDHGFRGAEGIIASYLLAGGGELALVEAGPESTQPALLAGIRAAGFEPRRITRLLLTHVHLDHAGGAGTLLRHLPEATVHVHPAGAPHLTDPGRLLESARRIYGDAMERLWGRVEPVAEARVRPLADGAEVSAGGRTLRALDTPGHAGHHLAFHDARAACVFTGDVAGIRLGGAPYVSPPTPPPDIDLPLWRGSLLRLRALAPRRLYLTHFGEVDDAAWHLDDLLARLYRWTGWVEGRLACGADPDTLAGELEEREQAAIRAFSGGGLAERYALAIPYGMSVDGLLRALRRGRT